MATRASLKPVPVDFEDKWSKINNTVSKILSFDHISRMTWSERFSDVYALCIAHPEPLADKLYNTTKLLLRDHVIKLCQQISAHSDGDILAEYFKHWDQYSKGSKYLDSLYLYLNTHHVEKHKTSESDSHFSAGESTLQSGVQEMGELCLDLWRTEVIFPLEDRLIAMLLQGIRQDRENKTLDNPSTVIRGVIMSFIDVLMYRQKTKLELYEEKLERDIIKETGVFYKREASHLLQTYSISQYMSKVLTRQQDERLRATKFLPSSSHKRVEKEIQASMVGDHIQALEAEAWSMVSEERGEDLRNLYTLLKPLPKGLDFLLRLLQEHVVQKGLESIRGLTGENIPQSFVDNLLSVHRRYSEKIRTWFDNDTNFTNALGKAFEKIINNRPAPKKPNMSSEYLAKYCDFLLRKSTKGLSDGEVEEKLCNTIILFKYVDDKDVFHKFYSKHLARRLIQLQSQSKEYEESMINKLKNACGYEYTSKLHRMFTDVAVSEGLNIKYSDYLLENELSLGIHFNMFVLQTGAWPMGSCAITPFNVPQQLEKSIQEFENFYHQNFSGRRLTWMHHLSQGELKCNFAKRTYVVSLVSTYQMGILLMFESVNSIVYSELQLHTGMNDEQFTRFLQSLLDCKILLCDDKESGLDSTIRLNLDYNNKRTRFKITVAAAKEVVQETEKIHASAEEERKIYLQAAIVRIMKSRKVLKHNLLVQEVINQAKCRFVPQVPMIKKCIETLIDKTYIERSDVADEYKYCA